MTLSSPNPAIQDLQRQIARLERQGAGALPRSSLPLGIPRIDALLPEGGLPLGCLHEVSGAAADGFLAVIAGRLRAPLLWCLDEEENERPYAPALRPFGLAPGAAVFACCRSSKDLLWAMEEGLRSGALGLVVADVRERIDLAASRRLQLAAGAGGATGILLPRRSDSAPLNPSAAVTRWRVEPAPQRRRNRPRWHLELLRNRKGQHGAWIVEWQEKEGRLALVSALADRPAEAERESVPA